ncbi:MAG: glycosyltransferase family 4 protein [Planctomycetota bacterium]
MAPAVGGMATVVEQLLAGPLADSFAFIRRPANGLATRKMFVWATMRGAARHVRQLMGLTRGLLSRRIDLVHIHTCSGFTFYRNLIDAAVARWCGVPVIIHIHGAQFDQFCARSGRLGRRMIRCGLMAADRVVVLSDRWRELLIQYAPGARFVVVPNGVVVPHMAGDGGSAIARQPCRFLFLGAICRRKGIDVLLEAAHRLRERGVDYHLTIAGPEEQPGDGRKLYDDIRRKDLEACVQYVGTVIGPHRDALLAECNCLVLPSRAEGLPLTLLEAGARGCATIATTVGAMPEVITGPHLGLLVPPADSLQLSREMERLATDATSRAEMGRALRRRIVADYSLQHQSSLLAGLYRELCGGLASFSGRSPSWQVTGALGGGST